MVRYADLEDLDKLRRKLTDEIQKLLWKVQDLEDEVKVLKDKVDTLEYRTNP